MTFLVFLYRHFPPSPQSSQFSGTETCRAVARMEIRAHKALPGFNRLRRVLPSPNSSWIWKDFIKRFSEAGGGAVTPFGTEESLHFDVCGALLLREQAACWAPGRGNSHPTNGEIAFTSTSLAGHCKDCKWEWIKRCQSTVNLVIIQEVRHNIRHQGVSQST